MLLLKLIGDTKEGNVEWERVRSEEDHSTTLYYWTPNPEKPDKKIYLKKKRSITAGRDFIFFDLGPSYFHSFHGPTNTNPAESLWYFLEANLDQQE